MYDFVNNKGNKPQIQREYVIYIMLLSFLVNDFDNFLSNRQKYKLITLKKLKALLMTYITKKKMSKKYISRILDPECTIY